MLYEIGIVGQYLLLYIDYECMYVRTPITRNDAALWRSVHTWLRYLKYHRITHEYIPESFVIHSHTSTRTENYAWKYLLDLQFYLHPNG